MAFEQPAYGPVRISSELKKKGVFISPVGVRSEQQRHDLDTFTKRLKALESRVGQGCIVLTEAQVIAFERKQ